MRASTIFEDLFVLELVNNHWGRLEQGRKIAYLDGLVRGMYTQSDLPVSQALCDDDISVVIPLQERHIFSRELMHGETLLASVAANKPVTVDSIDGPYAENTAPMGKISQLAV